MPQQRLQIDIRHPNLIQGVYRRPPARGTDVYVGKGWLSAAAVSAM